MPTILRLPLEPHSTRAPSRKTRLAGAALCLLAGAGVHAQATDSAASPDAAADTVLVVRQRAELPAEYAGGQVGSGGRLGMLGNSGAMESAFTLTSYTEQLIRELQARSVADVMQSDASVRVARGSGNFQELYVVRGFPVYSDDVSYNGLYGVLPRQYVAAELLERVEVLRGANTFVNGAAPGGSGIGGSVNLVPKHALDEDVSRLTLGYESASLGLGAGDVSRRFGRNGELGVRINAAHREGEGSVDREDREISVIAAGLDHSQPGSRVSLDVGRQDNRIDAPRPSVTPAAAAPRAPRSQINFAQPWTLTEDEHSFAVARADLDPSERVALWAAVGAREGTEHNVLANPTADESGALRASRFENFRRDRVATGELGVRGESRTGPVKHQLFASASAFRLISRNAFASSAPVGLPGSLEIPIDVDPPAPNIRIGGQPSAPLVTNRVRTKSFAVGDVLSFFSDRARVTLGARYQVIEQYGYDFNSGVQTSGYDRSATTPIATVLVKTSRRISVYANAVEGLTQGGVAPLVVGTVVVSNGGEVLSPSRSKQREIGLKYDGGEFGGTIAAFRVRRPSALLDDTVYRATGEQVNEGLELSWYGRPSRRLRALGGITLLDARATRTQDGQNDGNRVIGTPKAQANAGFDWDSATIRGLTLDGRIVYTGSQWINAANTASIPSWTRVDLGVRYRFSFSGKQAALRASVENATDESMWASVGGTPGANYLMLGQPRTFAVSIAVDL